MSIASEALERFVCARAQRDFVFRREQPLDRGSDARLVVDDHDSTSRGANWGAAVSITGTSAVTRPLSTNGISVTRTVVPRPTSLSTVISPPSDRTIP